MNRIEISLPESWFEFITAQVDAGRFADASDYLAQLVARDAEFSSTIDRIAQDPSLGEMLEQGLDSGAPRLWSKSRLEAMKTALR